VSTNTEGFKVVCPIATTVLQRAMKVKNLVINH